MQSINKKLINLKNILIRSNFHYFRMAMVHPPYWISANGKSCQVFADDNLGSITCYREVIIDDCYDIFNYSKQVNPSVIVDIGANVGMFSKLCSLLFPNADIYAYEPNPNALKWLDKNSKDTRIKVFPYAVSNEMGVLMLDTECDSTIGRINQSGKTSVKSIAASEVAESRQIDLLKMDCEGSEWSILRDKSLLQRTQYFCLEYHLYDERSIKDLKTLIQESGHQISRISYNTAYGEKFGLLWSSRISRKE
ncbi:FkbM family methyltransferase [Floridanema evergladense]|uniref:FkbM family methyltransferase n=1 Tax=Floridaenema evergladense BLCC-F167 TaxID=3153639 RepID=A0ABV4WG25_9CYAN